MKIGVVGCGALGSYYGALLARQSHEVHFLLRSDYDVVRRSGVRILSPLGDFTVSPHCARSPQEIGACDWVIVGLKSTANAVLGSLLPPLAGPHAAVLTLQNGLGNEECLARIVPAAQVLGGLAFVCLNRIEPGRVRHIAHGRIVMGEFGRPADARTRALADSLRAAGVDTQVTDDLAQAHWEKLVWNIPFNGLGVAGAAGLEAVLTGRWTPGTPLGPCLSTQDLLGDPRWERCVRELMREVIRAAHALGHGLEDSLEERHIVSTRSMGPYRASTLVDFEKGLPLETEALFMEPLRRAEAARVPVPRLAALAQLLARLDPARRPGAPLPP
jgi:2-dehydropantoate 2-reductase